MHPAGAVAQRAALKSERVPGRLCWLPVCLIMRLFVPATVGYIVFAYRVFWGEATELDDG